MNRLRSGGLSKKQVTHAPICGLTSQRSASPRDFVQKAGLRGSPFKKTETERGETMSTTGGFSVEYAVASTGVVNVPAPIVGAGLAA